MGALQVRNLNITLHFAQDAEIAKTSISLIGEKGYREKIENL